MVVPWSMRITSPGSKTEMSLQVWHHFPQMSHLRMNAAIVSPASPSNAVLRDNDISDTCVDSCSSTVVLSDCHYANSERGSAIFIAKYIAVVRVIFYMLESGIVRGCFLPHLPESVGDVLNVRIVVPTETGIATTVKSRGLPMNGFSQRIYAFGYKIGIRSFGSHVDVATPESGYRWDNGI